MSGREGLFLTVEGIDNAGKSSVIKHVANKLDKLNVDFVRTSEPSGEWIGKAVRRAIAEESAEDPLTTFMLFMADRNKHVEDVIVPALEEGKVVISDRFVDSTYVYQSIALEPELRGNTIDYIEDVMYPIERKARPDITFYIDISVEESLARDQGGDVYENRDFLYDVKRNYDDRLGNYNVYTCGELYNAGVKNNRAIYIIDGEQDMEKVVQDVMDVLTVELSDSISRSS